MTPTIIDIIKKIKANQADLGITLYDKASTKDISDFEHIMGIQLPDDIFTFYRFCNGFESDEDIFRIIPLDEIIDRKKNLQLIEQNDFHIAEYMTYCDMWTININRQDKNNYTIYNMTDSKITLTDSFSDFLNKFLTAGVFDGLYKWRDEIEQASR